MTSSSDGVLRLWHTPAAQLAELPLVSLIDQPLGNIPIELEQRYYTPAREAIVAGRVAEAAQIILQIEADRPQDPQIGRLLASSPETARAIGALRWQSQRVRLIQSVEGLRGEPAVAFARLSSRLLTAVYDGGVPLIGPRRLVAAAYQIDTSLSALGDPAVEIAVDARIGHIAFSGDGQLVATAEEDGAVRIRRSGDGSVFRTVGGDEEGLLVSAFSPDGQTLITGGADGLVRVWRVDSGEPQLSLPAHEGAATAVAFSLDGQSFASAGVDGVVRLWRAGDGQALQVFEGHSGPVASLAFSPDTLSLASGGADRTVRLWRTNGGRLEVLEGHLDLVSGLAFSPDGQTVASGSQDGTVRLWRVADGADLQTLSDQTGTVTRLAFSDDGRVLAVGDASKAVRLYQAPAAVLSDPALQRVVNQPAIQVVAASTPAAANTGRVVNVGTLSLRVRAEPSREAAIAGRLQQNADVTIIDTRHKSGMSSGCLLKPVGPVGEC